MKQLELLKRVIREAANPSVDMSKLSDADLADLLDRAKAERDKRQSSKRQTITSVQEAYDLIRDVAQYEKEWDADLMEYVFKWLGVKFPDKESLLAELEQTTSSLHHAAYQMEHDELDEEDLDAMNEYHERDFKKLEKMFDKLQRPSR